MFLEISQNSQENTCARVSLSLKVSTFLKKRLWHRCFPVNFAKFLTTPFFQNTSGRLLLLRYWKIWFFDNFWFSLNKLLKKLKQIIFSFLLTHILTCISFSFFIVFLTLFWVARDFLRLKKILLIFHCVYVNHNYFLFLDHSLFSHTYH